MYVIHLRHENIHSSQDDLTTQWTITYTVGTVLTRDKVSTREEQRVDTVHQAHLASGETDVFVLFLLHSPH